MTERIINLESINPVDIFGVNDRNIELLKIYFPKIKIIARGEIVKICGEKEELSAFESKFESILMHYDKLGKLTERDIVDIVENGNGKSSMEQELNEDILVHGRNGMMIKARTANQQLMVDECQKNDLLFAIGPAGSGKTYTAVALAVRALKNKEVKRIILTRPAVEAGENLGFLPGELRDKLDHYLQPL